MGNICNKTGSDVAIEQEQVESKDLVTDPEPAETVPQAPPAPVEEKAPEAAPASAPAPAPTGPTAAIEFLVGGGERKEVIFTEGPLGIVFKQLSPVTVEAVIEGGVADKAGVQKGWIFDKIAGESVEGKDQVSTMDALRKVCEPLSKVTDDMPAGAVVVEFVVAEGRVRRVGFERKPLGITLDSGAPTLAKAIVPGSVAEKQGVKVGWTLRTIAGISVVNLPYKELLDVVGSSTKDLPQA
jgi:hypothetical protein